MFLQHFVFRFYSNTAVVLVTQLVVTGPAQQPSVSIDSTPATGSGSTGIDQFVPPGQAFVISEEDTCQAQSDKELEEGEISDAEDQEKNEEMNYRETVRAVRAFLGFTHIADFEASTGDYDRSDNSWKGKHPSEVRKGVG